MRISIRIPTLLFCRIKNIMRNILKYYGAQIKNKEVQENEKLA